MCSASARSSSAQRNHRPAISEVSGGDKDSPFAHRSAHGFGHRERIACGPENNVQAACRPLQHAPIHCRRAGIAHARGLIDPGESAKSSSLLAARLRDELVRANAELSTLKSYMRLQISTRISLGEVACMTFSMLRLTYELDKTG